MDKTNQPLPRELVEAMTLHRGREAMTVALRELARTSVLDPRATARLAAVLNSPEVLAARNTVARHQSTQQGDCS